MSLAEKFLAVLDEFRAEVAAHVNSGQLVTIDNHIDTIAGAVENDTATADTKAKEVLGALYGALHGTTGDQTPTAPVEQGQAAAAAPAAASAPAAAPAGKAAAAAPATPTASGTGTAS